MRWPTPASGSTRSSRTTTTSTGTRASAGTPPPPSTSEPPKRSATSARSPSPRHTPATPNASAAAPDHPRYPRPPGSTTRPNARNPHHKPHSVTTVSLDLKSSGDGGKSGYGQSCGTNDLDFTVTSESQAGGYYLVTAKAKSGITCYLDVNTPSVSFGSGADGVASPVGQGGEDPIKLTGSAVAYTGISPKTTKSNAGKQFENVIIAISDNDPNPAELKLPDTANVDKPIVTNWSTNRAETVPVIV
ncbi:hypothetical protein [Streptomyces sp. NBC_01474]|uniref:hypothetical protein n=1 Tax=Streptomyces sp. NBC_01474 TaxID=2903880 RepID=UPI003FA389F8